ncbi:MAG: CCA tRNA nucleotidyltransferase [Victivallaceae bacterium]
MNPIFQAALEIIHILRKVDCPAYFVGGCVRDMLLNLPMKDIDIATVASPAILTTMFPKSTTVGANFGVVVVRHQNISFEISTFRSDGYYADGRHPVSIELASMKEDAFRRDFTINGLFYDPESKKVYDYVGGRSDLERKILRTIGLPRQRFSEDKLRLIRAVRFAAKLDFTIEDNTKKAIAKAAPSLIPSVSVERIWLELKKMNEHPRFTIALSLLHELRLLVAIFPELKQQTTFHIKKSFRALESISSSKSFPTILLLQPLFNGLDEETIIKAFRRFKISNKEFDILKKWCSLKSHLQSKRTDRIFWTHFFIDVNSDLLLKFALILIPDQKEKSDFLAKIRNLKEELEPHILRLISQRPLLSAEDLIMQGVPQGRLLGDLLREAEYLTIEHNYANKDEVLAKLRAKGFWK